MRPPPLFVCCCKIYYLQHAFCCKTGGISFCSVFFSSAAQLPKILSFRSESPPELLELDSELLPDKLLSTVKPGLSFPELS